MKLRLLALIALVFLAACKTEDQRAHERNLEAMRLQAQMQTAQIQIASDERRANKRTAMFGGVMKIGLVLGTIGGIFFLITNLLERRLRHIRDTRIREFEEATTRHKYLVDLVMNPENGLTGPERVKAITAAAQAASAGALPHYPETS